jgi:hypothetical protein
MPTEILGLEVLVAGQPQKEVTVNTALRQIEGWVRALSITTTTPPSSPAAGDTYIVPAGATGAWADQTNKLAHYYGGGWKFRAPPKGITTVVLDEGDAGVEYLFNNDGAWVPNAGGVSDGDKGDITVVGDTWTIDSSVISTFGRTLTDDANAAAARTTLGLGTVATLAADTDTALAANSDTKVATQKAVKAYVDGAASGSAATVTTMGALINGATSKTTPVDADYVGLMDSAASNVLKKLSWANIKAALKTYFDTLYAPVGGGGGSQPFDLTAFYPGVPTASALATRVPLARAVTFPPGLAGSVAKSSVAATASTTFTLKKNGASIGTAIFAAGASSATFSGGGAAALSATRWRLYITGRESGGANTGVSEWQMREVVGVTQLPSGGTITAESTYNSGYLPANAIDGNINTFWSTFLSPANTWLQYDYAAAKNIVEYAISMQGSAGSKPTAFQLQYWNTTTSAWVTVDSRTGITWPGTDATQVFSVGSGSASDLVFAAGDVFSLTAPATPDATLADIGFVFAGTR